MEQAAIEMPRYKCHKEVWALKIKAVEPGMRDDDNHPGNTLIFEDPRYAPISVDESWVAKHNPQDGGYYVVYQDGYKSFSPAEAFESGYTLINHA